MSLLLLFQGSVATTTLYPSLVTNNQTFFSPTITTGAVTLSPSLYTNTQTFYSATITVSYTLQPSLFNNIQTFYSPTVSQAGVQSLFPSLFTNNNVFYGPTVTALPVPVVIVDGHDGDKGKRKKRWDEDRQARERRRAQIIDVYEQLVEGRPAVAKEIVAPYTQSGAKSTVAAAPQIDFDRLLGDLDRVQRLYREYQEMDDEDVLLLI